MADELDEMKRLSPEERLKRLKELEEKRKREIKAAEDLIRKTEHELEEEKKERMRTPIQQLKSVDIDSLTTDEERQMFATKRFAEVKLKPSAGEEGVKVEVPKEESSLEKTVFEEQLRLTPEELEQQRAYEHAIAKDLTAGQIYNGLTNLDKSEGEKGYLTMSEQRERQSLVYAAKYKQDAIQKGDYVNPPKEAEQQLSKIFSKYKQ